MLDFPLKGALYCLSTCRIFIYAIFLYFISLHTLTMDITIRDVLIQRIESEIVRIQTNITTRLIELKQRKEDNFALRDVYSDYKRYHDIIRQQREDQTKTLQFLLEYLENSMEEAGLTEQANEDAKQQYKAIEAKLVPGSVIVADNVIRSKNQMLDFLGTIQKDPRYLMVIIRASDLKKDGMAVIYKLK